MFSSHDYTGLGMNAFPIIVTYTTDSERFTGSSDIHANPRAFGKA